MRQPMPTRGAQLMNESDIAGLAVIVTGSAVGIGRAIATRFAALGASVAGLDIDAVGNADTAAGTGSQFTPVLCDVGDAVTVKSAVDRVAAATGRIDVLVNNAAVWNDTRLTAGTYEEQVAAMQRAMGACAMGSFHCAAAVVPHMRNVGGNIVNLLTNHIRLDQLITGLPATGYDAAKFAQWRFTESWAQELASLQIRVNGLAFGATDTPMLRAVSARIANEGMRANDMAEAVLNIVLQGRNGDVGQTYDVGFTGTPRATSLEQIAALRVPRQPRS